MRGQISIELVMLCVVMLSLSAALFPQYKGALGMLEQRVLAKEFASKVSLLESLIQLANVSEDGTLFRLDFGMPVVLDDSSLCSASGCAGLPISGSGNGDVVEVSMNGEPSLRLFSD